jgi:hypothetical protein
MRYAKVFPAMLLNAFTVAAQQLVDEGLAETFEIEEVDPDQGGGRYQITINTLQPIDAGYETIQDQDGWKIQWHAVAPEGGNAVIVDEQD